MMLEVLPEFGRILKLERPGLYLVASPIGNMRDLSLRAIDVLAGCDMVVCEDRRVTQKLLNAIGIRQKLYRYDDHSNANTRTHLLDFAEAGHALALLSDAGTPLVSDPGFKLVRAALARDLAVRAIPGASAALCALIQSGLPCHKFTFYGFIPRKPGAWDQMAEQLDRDTGTAILFEAARNIGKTLERMARRWPGRTAMLARELTKRNETCWHAELARLNARWCEQGIARGEITLVLGPITPSNLPAADKERSMAIAKILADAHTKNLSVRDRTKQLMDECNLPRRDAYQLALQSVQN